jgi:hypothetical protein
MKKRSGSFLLLLLLIILTVPVYSQTDEPSPIESSPPGSTVQKLTERGVWFFEMAAPTLLFYDLARDGELFLGNMLFSFTFTDFVFMKSGPGPFLLTFEGGAGMPPLVSTAPDYPGVEISDSEGESPATLGVMLTAYAGAGFQWITGKFLMALTAGPGGKIGYLLSFGSRQPEGEALSFAFGAVNLKTGFLFGGFSVNLDTRFGYGWGTHEWSCDEEIGSGSSGTSSLEGWFFEFSVSLALWPSWPVESPKGNSE